VEQKKEKSLGINIKKIKKAVYKDGFLRYNIVKERIKKMKVNSSTIAEINQETIKGQTFLKVTFVNGREYLYEGVTQKIYDEFVNADSKGKYFHENINGRYNYSRVK